MRVGVVLIGFVFMVVSAWFVSWLVHGEPQPGDPATVAAIEASKVENADIEPSPTGPHPKAVIDSTVIAFGRMEVGDERSHEFIIRNEGEAPLKLKKGNTTCQCTISEVAQNEVAPGAEAKVKLTWKPTNQTEMFEKGAEIKTNDPENRTIHLSIQGMVVPRIVNWPERAWNVAEVRDVGETEFKGAVVSPIFESFKVLGIESRDPAITAEAIPLEAAEANSMHGLSGYRILVKIQPTVAVGAFGVPLTIKTDIPKRDEEGTIDMEVLVTGFHQGPLRFMGREWAEDRAGVILGTFDSAVGKKVTLTLLVKGQTDVEMTFSKVESTPAGMEVSLKADDKLQGTARRYFVTFEYPAGGPRAAFNEERPGSLRVKTNHPQAPEMEFRLFMNAY